MQAQPLPIQKQLLLKKYSKVLKEWKLFVRVVSTSSFYSLSIFIPLSETKTTIVTGTLPDHPYYCPVDNKNDTSYYDKECTNACRELPRPLPLGVTIFKVRLFSNLSNIQLVHRRVQNTPFPIRHIHLLKSNTFSNVQLDMFTRRDRNKEIKGDKHSFVMEQRISTMMWMMEEREFNHSHVKKQRDVLRLNSQRKQK